jgi:hypothetical protein
VSYHILREIVPASHRHRFGDIRIGVQARAELERHCRGVDERLEKPNTKRARCECIAPGGCS